MESERNGEAENCRTAERRRVRGGMENERIEGKDKLESNREREREANHCRTAQTERMTAVVKKKGSEMEKERSWASPLARSMVLPHKACERACEAADDSTDRK